MGTPITSKKKFTFKDVDDFLTGKSLVETPRKKFTFKDVDNFLAGESFADKPLPEPVDLEPKLDFEQFPERIDPLDSAPAPIDRSGAILPGTPPAAGILNQPQIDPRTPDEKISAIRILQNRFSELEQKTNTPNLEINNNDLIEMNNISEILRRSSIDDKGDVARAAFRGVGHSFSGIARSIPALLKAIPGSDQILDRHSGSKEYVEDFAKQLSERIEFNTINKIPARPPSGKFARDTKSISEFFDLEKLGYLAAANSGQIALFMATNYLNPVVGTLAMISIESGSSLQAADEYEKRTGVKLDDDVKNRVALFVGLVNGAMERVGFDSILKTIKTPGLKKKIIRMLFSVVTEGSTEGFQGVVQSLGQEVYGGDKFETEKAINQFVQEFQAGMAMAMGTSSPSFAASVASNAFKGISNKVKRKPVNGDVNTPPPDNAESGSIDPAVNKEQKEFDKFLKDSGIKDAIEQDDINALKKPKDEVPKAKGFTPKIEDDVKPAPKVNLITEEPKIETKAKEPKAAKVKPEVKVEAPKVETVEDSIIRRVKEAKSEKDVDLLRDEMNQAIKNDEIDVNKAAIVNSFVSGRSSEIIKEQNKLKQEQKKKPPAKKIKPTERAHDPIDDVIKSGIRISDADFFKGKLREEMKGLRNRLGPGAFSKTGQTLDEHASNLGITEVELRDRLMARKSKAELQKEEDILKHELEGREAEEKEELAAQGVDTDIPTPIEPPTLVPAQNVEQEAGQSEARSDVDLTKPQDTDTSEIKQLRTRFQQEREILKTGNSPTGDKLTDSQLGGVKRSVENTRRKLIAEIDKQPEVKETKFKPTGVKGEKPQGEIDLGVQAQIPSGKIPTSPIETKGTLFEEPSVKEAEQTSLLEEVKVDPLEQEAMRKTNPQLYRMAQRAETVDEFIELVAKSAAKSIKDINDADLRRWYPRVERPPKSESKRAPIDEQIVVARPGATPEGGFKQKDSKRPKSLGKNKDGKPLFEDQNGVRSFTDKGVRVNEKVGIVPGGGISINEAARSDEFLTENEISAKKSEKTLPVPDKKVKNGKWNVDNVAAVRASTFKGTSKNSQKATKLIDSALEDISSGRNDDARKKIVHAKNTLLREGTNLAEKEAEALDTIQKNFIASKPGLTKEQYQTRIDQLASSGQIKTGEADIIKSITDALANKWAQWNNRKIEDFYPSTFLDIDPTADPTGVVNAGDSFRGDGFVTIGGRVRFAKPSAKAFIEIFTGNRFGASKADVFLHEIGHVLRKFMPEAEAATLGKWAHEGLEDANEWNGGRVWTVGAEEKFARAWEVYLKEGKAPNTTVQKIFEQLKQLFNDIFLVIDKPGIDDVELSEDVKQFFNSVFDAPGTAQEIQAETRTQPITKSGAEAMVSHIYGLLASGEGVKTNPKLSEIADKFFGGTRAEGFWDIRQAYDLLEIAINNHIKVRLNRTDFSNKAKRDNALAFLRNLSTLIPTQAGRTKESELFQQFSTPPALAYLAATVLDVQNNDFVLEPSAGTGSLAIFAEIAGAGKMHVNEIGDFRAKMLESFGWALTKENAEFINDLLPADIKPTAVLMNPPFSSTGGRVKSNDTKFGFRHVTSALSRLQDGGRLVAILGESAGLDRQKAEKFYEELAGKYKVRASINIEGEFKKFGTSFGNILLVVDKIKPDGNVASELNQVISGKFNTVEEALEGLRQIPQRSQIGTQEVTFQNSEGNVLEGEVSTRPNRDESTQGSGEKAGDSGVSGERLITRAGTTLEPGSRSMEGETEGDNGQNLRLPKEIQETARPEKTGTDTGRTGSGGVDARGSTNDIRESNVNFDNNEEARNRKEEVGGTFIEAVPQKLKGGNPHPGKIVETASMAATVPPDITYKHSLPGETLKHLSGLQLEVVHYAGQQHERKMLNGQRRGYFTGDGTGVGKGREIAGIIYDNFLKGRKKAVWFSFGKDLLKAGREDLANIGANEVAMENMGDWNIDSDIDLKDGVIFVTYTTLTSKTITKDGREITRLDQLRKWMGDEPVMVFDEGHKAKNAYNSGPQGASQTGEAVVDIQNLTPEARVVYASATGATEVSNMAYMTRLGLWGEGTAFDDFIDFVSAIDNGGVGSMEQVARELKLTGKFNSRALSFEGVEFDDEAGLIKTSPEQKKIYDSAAKIWQQVMTIFEENFNNNNAPGAAKRFATTQFWSTQQRFFKKILTSFKVPKLIELMEEDLSNGRTPVVSLVGTVEERTKILVAQAIANGEDLETIDITPRDSLVEYVERYFPTTQYIEVDAGEGKKKSIPLTDSNGDIVESREALENKARLLDEISALSFPDNPLDQIIRHFGEENIAELTGRKKRLVKNKATGKLEFVGRNPEGVKAKSVNEWEMENFQSGKKKIAIISTSASTGISLHASNEAKNQDKRVQYLFELSWSADTEMQRLGRTHRSNQKQPPKYVLMSTDIGGEKRFISTISKRMASLGALTKGERKSSGVDLSKYNYETPQGGASVSATIDNMLHPTEGNEIQNVNIKTLAKMGLLKEDRDGNMVIRKADTHNVTRFLNRMLMLELTEQNSLFERFNENFNNIIEYARQNGTFDDGLVSIKGDNVRVEGKRQVVSTDKSDGIDTVYQVVSADVKVKYMSFEDAASAVERSGKEFFIQKRSKNFVIAGKGADRTDQRTGRVNSTKYVTDYKATSKLINEVEFSEKYEQVTAKEAKKWWTEKIATAPPIKTQKHNILSGSILPIWGKLTTAVGLSAEGNPGRMGMVSIKTEDGERMVGLEIPSRAMGDVLAMFNLDSNVSADNIYEAVMVNGQTIKLEDGISLKRTRFHNEETVEVLTDGIRHYSALRKIDGIIEETFNFRRRFFIPLDDETGPEIAQKVIDRFPLTENIEKPELLDISVKKISVDDFFTQIESDLGDVNDALKVREVLSKHGVSKKEINNFFRTLKGDFVPERIQKKVVLNYLDANVRKHENRKEGLYQIFYREAKTPTVGLISNNKSVTFVELLWGKEAAEKFAREKESEYVHVKLEDTGLLNVEHQKVSPYFSKLKKLLQDKLQDKSDVGTVRGITKNIKKEEIFWSGLDDFLANNPKFTKKEILEYLDENEATVGEVILGGGLEQYRTIPFVEEDRKIVSDIISKARLVENIIGENFNLGESPATIKNALHALPDNSFSRKQLSIIEKIRKNYPKPQPTKFHQGALGNTQLELPNGKEYRETLITLQKRGNIQITDRALYGIKVISENEFTGQRDVEIFYDGKSIAKRSGTREKDGAIITEAKISRDNSLQASQTRGFRGGHFNEDNIIAHTRSNVREIDGEEVLHIEEIQSDWHQKARKARLNQINFLIKQRGLTKEEAKKSVPVDFGYEDTAERKRAEKEIGETRKRNKKVRLNQIESLSKAGIGVKVPTLQDIVSEISTLIDILNQKYGLKARPSLLESEHRIKKVATKEEVSKLVILDEAARDKEHVLSIIENERVVGFISMNPTARRQAGAVNVFIKSLTQETLSNLQVVGNTYKSDNEAALKAIDLDVDRVQGAVPLAPFRNTWHELAFRRMVREAADEGFSKITWTTGRTQIDRYEQQLRQNIDSIQYEVEVDEDTGEKTYTLEAEKDETIVYENTGLSIEEIEDIAGKELAKKIANNEGSKLKDRPLRPDMRELKGSDFSIGGEGMKGFYDNILVNYAKKFGKKFGASVGSIDINIPKGSTFNWVVSVVQPDGSIGFLSDSGFTTAIANATPFSSIGVKIKVDELRESKPGWRVRGVLSGKKELSDKIPVHFLEITDSMVQTAQFEGFSLYDIDAPQEKAIQEGLIYINENGINVNIPKIKTSDDLKTVIDYLNRKAGTSASAAISGIKRYLREKNIITPKMDDIFAERERSLPKTLEEGGLEGGTERFYEVETDQAALDEATKRIAENEVAANRFVLDEKDDITKEQVVTGILLLGKLREEMKGATGLDKDNLAERSIDIANSLSVRLTQAGQAIQGASIIARLDPEALLIVATRKIEAYNKGKGKFRRRLIITPEDVKNINQLSEEAGVVDELDKKMKEVAGIVEKISNGDNLKKSDLEKMSEVNREAGRKFGTKPIKFSKSAKLAAAAIDKASDEARSRLRKKGILKFKDIAKLEKGALLDVSQSKEAALDQSIFSDLVTIGAGKFKKTGLKFIEWSATMIEDFGAEIKPHLKSIFEASVKLWKVENKKAFKGNKFQKELSNILRKLESSTEISEVELDEMKKQMKIALESTGDARTEVLLGIRDFVNGLTPASFGQVLSTTQTIGHLLNPKTMIRNFGGNEIFFRLERINKYVATAIDAMIVDVSEAVSRTEFGKKRDIKRQNRVITFKKAGQGDFWKGFAKGAKAGWHGHSFNDLETKFSLRGQTFKSRHNPLHWLENAMGAGLRSFDTAAYMRGYNQFLGEQAELAIINQGLAFKDKASKDKFVLDFMERADIKILALADKAGLYITFQDENIISNSAVAFKRILNADKDFGFGDLILKYPKTPGNLLHRAIQYSPLGVINGIAILNKTFTAPNAQRLELIMALSRAITGTFGLTAIGAILFAAGAISGRDDEDRDIRNFNAQQTGERNYQFNASAITRFITPGSGWKKSLLVKREGDILISYDWALPVSMNIAAGANIAMSISEQKGAVAGSSNLALDILNSAIGTLAEQSLVRGLVQTFGQKRFKANILDGVMEVLVGVPSTFTPTLLSQINQLTSDNIRRTSYDASLLQRSINKMMYKLPFVSKSLAKVYKTIGGEPAEMFQNGSNTLFNVFFNPAFISKYHVDPEIQMIIMPNLNEDRKKQYPRLAPYTIRAAKSTLRRHGIKTENERENFVITSHDRSEMQRIMAEFVEVEFRKINPEKMARKSFEKQEKEMADIVNRAHSFARKWFFDNRAKSYLGIDGGRPRLKRQRRVEKNRKVLKVKSLTLTQ